MSSRDQMLSKLRNTLRQAIPLPTSSVSAIQYPNLEEQFSQALTGVGGKALPLQKLADLPSALQNEPFFPSAQRICSCLPGQVCGNLDLEEFSTPHELENIDISIVPAEFGVAENGAVWLTDSQLKHRAILFIVQHLVVILPRRQLVHTMQEAYTRISFPQPGFGLFLSGPSKTADIEQSLVIGAHGPRSLTLFLLEEETDLHKSTV